jgi:hypothetical protein
MNSASGWIHKIPQKLLVQHKSAMVSKLCPEKIECLLCLIWLHPRLPLTPQPSQHLPYTFLGILFFAYAFADDRRGRDGAI